MTIFATREDFLLQATKLDPGEVMWIRPAPKDKATWNLTPAMVVDALDAQKIAQKIGGLRVGSHGSSIWVQRNGEPQ